MTKKLDALSDAVLLDWLRQRDAGRTVVEIAREAKLYPGHVRAFFDDIDRAERSK
jgi:hypothetical protein